MKRLRVDESVKEGSGPLTGTLYHRQQLTTAAATLAYSTSGGGGGGGVGVVGGTVKVVSDSMQSGLFTPATPVNYAAAAPHAAKTQPMQTLSMNAGGGGGGGSSQLRTNNSGSSPPNSQQVPQPNQDVQQQQQQQTPAINFQRLKVEDALSYLDMVKFKFSSKPQVYNDFLDIMKEFKSQSIDTPGVIQRVSNLFKGFPELIVGFNTFLPPGYKIEVQKSDQGYAFQVSVSMPSPTGGTMTSDPQQQHQPRSTMVLKGSGTINNMSGQQQQQQQPTNIVAAAPQQQPQQAQQQQQQQQQQPLPQQHPPSQQPLPLTTQHIAAAPVATPQAALTASSVHHGSSYGGSNTPAYGLTLTAAQAAVALQGHNADTPQNQPVEFNHAINYVNKIKNRFQGQPEKYKKFLEILHTYQKEQRTLKESSSIGGGGGGIGKHLTEQEVYSQVAKLFENQNDLLAEFGQFLPDATNHINQQPIQDHTNSVNKKPTTKPYRGSSNTDHILDRHISSHKQNHVSGPVKRSPPYSNYHRDVPPTKKHKMSSSCRDVSLAEASKYGTLNDYAFFDKVRKAVRSQEVYNNFLRCLTLFNQEIVSKSELIQIVTPFLSKFPELLRWFRVFMGQNDVDPIPYNVARTERPQGDHALEIDLATAKRLGASYCIIPKAQEGQRCSGRTQLCKEVLNDQWVSFPTWSEDSTFVSSRKTQYEEYMYRCEDERFELDVVIETNASTIRVLEGVNKKLSRMNQDEVTKYKLDDCLGGTSPTLHQRALKRIYGDKAQDIIDGLKRNPSVAVPVVLRRLKAKEDEWREAQKGFNKIWREQNEKYYLKSLDHQGINFKQTDVKALRSKSLFNEIETIFDERHEQNEEGAEPIVGPHLILHYKDRTILDDAANLIIHHIKRQTGTQKGEKRKIKYLLRQFLPDLFFHPRQPLSDDEREEDDDKDEESPNSSPNDKSKGSSSPNKSPARADGGVGVEPMEIKTEPDLKDDDIPVPLHAQSSDPEEAYTLFMANNNWYIFLRLHAILCDRLARIYERACLLAEEETKSCTNRKDSTAIALRLKPKPQIEIEDYYPAFLDMVKNVLDGNMESNTYEDTLREMFGIHAYIAFTLDKVVQYAVRQLQHCVTERTAVACTELFSKEQKRSGTGGPCATAYRRAHLEMQYQRAAEKAVQDENCFKIYIYKKDCRMTIELLDTEPEDTKKVDETKKWNTYKERYADCTITEENKQRSPVYLNRNLRLYKKRISTNNNSGGSKEKKNNQVGEQPQQQQAQETQQNNNNNNGNGGGETSKRLLQQQQDENNGNNTTNSTSGGGSKNTTNNNKDQDANFSILDTFERKLNERPPPPPERNQTEHVGYDVSDEQQCKFSSQDSKIMFTVNKDSYLYKISAFYRARQSHPNVTKHKANRFRAWSKQWVSANVSDVQQKQCTDWMMGRGEGVVPNRTRVLTDNDLTQSPYAPYNRYRVEKMNEDAT